MSYRKSAFRLDDMCSAILKIQRYVNGYGFEDFIGDEKTQDAVIRQLTIIGEAVTHLPEAITSLAPEIPWTSVRGMRNIIVHDYLSVDMRIVWNTVTKDPVSLGTQLEDLRGRLIDKPKLSDSIRRKALHLRVTFWYYS